MFESLEERIVLSAVTVGNGNEPFIAVDPFNPDNVAVGWNFGVSFSTDGAENFTAAALPANYSGDPGLAIDSAGQVFFSYLLPDAGIPADLDIGVSQTNFFAQNVAGNQIIISNPDNAINTGDDDDKELITADWYTTSPFRDNVYVAWRELNQEDLLFSRSTDSGTSFSAPAAIANAGGFNTLSAADPEVGPNGEVYVGYWRGNSLATGTSGQIEVVKSTDGGVSFGAGVLVSAAQGTAGLDATLLEHNAGGQQNLPNQTFKIVSRTQLDIEADPLRNGYVYAIWSTDPTGDTTGDGADVLFSRSIDGGVNWSFPTTLNDDGGTLSQFMPSIGVDEAGNLTAIWYDERLSPNVNDPNLSIFAKVSTDGGATWSPDFVLEDSTFDPDSGGANTFIGDYIQVAAADGVGYATWVQTDGTGTNQILVEKFSLQAAFPDAFEPNNTLSNATVLGSLPKITLQDLTIHNEDDLDWFKITAQDTGKLVINAFFDDEIGDIDIQVQDMNGNLIASSISTTDNEQIVIPVVSQEMYFLRVNGFSNDKNHYDLEIENFPAPVPSGVHLDPASDTGMMSNDNYTADSTPRFIIQADLSDFDDMGINILDANELANQVPGAAVEVFVTNSTTGLTTSGFATQIGGASTILFEFTPAFLGNGVYFVSAAVRIFDGQRDANGFVDPATGRTQLSEPLWVTIDTFAPAPSLPDMLTSSDTGMFNDDDVTSKMSPAFSGQGEPNAKVRVLADGVIVGQGVVNTNGLWEVTVEPMADGVYNITTELEDLAGNISVVDPEEPLDPLVIWIDGTEPNTPFMDLLTDTGHSSTDNITNDNTPDFLLIGDDTVDGNGNPFPNDVKYRVYWRPGNGAGEVLVYDSFADLGGLTNLGSLLVTLTQDLNNPAGTPFPEGVNNFKLEVEDRAGNISPDFLLSIEIDTQVPDAVPPDMLASSDTGMFMDDNVTNKMSPAFSNAPAIFAGASDPLDSNSWRFDGPQVSEWRAAIEDLANFGPAGVIPFGITTVDLTSGPITASDLVSVDVFVSSFWSDSQSASSVAAIVDYFLAGGNLFLLQDSTDFDAIGDALGIPTFAPSNGSVSNNGAPLFDGPFGLAVNVAQSGTVGQLSAADVAAAGGTIAATNGGGQVTAAIWNPGDYALGAGALVIMADVNMIANDTSDYVALNDNGTFALNATAFLAEAGTLAEPNSAVDVYAQKIGVDGPIGAPLLVGEGLVNTNGIWEVTVEPLADGVYDIYVQYEDWAGNFSPLSDPLRIEIDTLTPNTAFLDLLESSDSGRHDDDNVTNDNTPTVSMTTEDPNAALHQILFTDNLKFRIFDRFENDQEFLLYNSVLDTNVDNTMTPGDGFTSLEQILETLPDQFFNLVGVNNAVLNGGGFGVLADGIHNLKLEVEDRAGNISHDFLFDLLIDTVAPPVTIIGIDPSSTDTGVEGFPATFTDRVTSDTGTGFIGRAEADAIVRLYVDDVNNDMIDIPAQFALTVAVPLDGDDAFPNGEWRTSFIRDLNDPAFFQFDRLREVIVTAEDLAGNLNGIYGIGEEPEHGEDDFLQMLDIFIDTQGPQVTDVFLTNHPAFNLFDVKPADGPTPPVFSITIDLQDFPRRDDDDPNFLYEALLQAVAQEPGHYLLRGDHNGVIDINNIFVINDPRFDNAVATASVILQFNSPLPDDRYTLTLSDTLVDPVGNALDGETNTLEPNETPLFPSGDQQPGGDFVARFTVDSRAEIGTYAHSNVYLDINGNLYFDPTNVDHTNRDLVSQFGLLNDDLFAGNFDPPGEGGANGFDKLGAYGQEVGGLFYFTIDFDGNMDVDPGERFVSNLQINAIPVAGDFNRDGVDDEIGLFDGTTWYLDTTGDYLLDTTITGDLRGFPIVGDFNGDGFDDLATYQADLFRFDINFDGNADDTIAFGFPGVLDRPVAADLNLDGIDDIGLFVPNRDGVLPGVQAEWFFLVSDRFPEEHEENGFVQNLPSDLFDPFSPVPLGNDIFAQFGDDLAVPLIGNFDPPVAAAAPADPTSPSGVGLYDAEAGAFLLKNETSAGVADTMFRYGPQNAGWQPVTGDWDGNSTSTVGLFDPIASKFFLTNDNATGVADLTFRFGPSGAGWTPLSGDWDGDGEVSVGLYAPNSGTFFLKNENTAGNADLMFRYGPAGAGWTPLVGDWNDDGTDTIGLFAADQGVFFLRDSNSAGFADTKFRYGPVGSGWTPIVGDWDGDGDDTAGLYNPASSVYYLRNENTAGVADELFRYGPTGSGWTPLAGDWDGVPAAASTSSSNLSSGLASFLASSTSSSDSDSGQESVSAGLLNSLSLAATSSTSSSTGSTGESGSSGAASGNSTEEAADETLDLALVELAGELSSGGLIDPAI